MIRFPNLSRSQKAIVLGSWLGWALDGYDLVLMLFVISSVSQLFFPTEDQKLSLLATFATYAVTLVVRPLGGAIFGSLGDRLGRKRSMIITITGFSVATFATGLLPTWAMAGILAPLLLITLRITQGLFAGGEWGSGAVITMESVPKNTRGLLSGFVQSGFPLGFLIASVAYEFVSVTYPHELFSEMGWRVMFFTGIIPGLLTLFIRMKMGESEIWLEKRNKAKIDKAPLRRVVFGNQRKSFFLALVITTGLMYSYYASIGLMPTFLQDYAGLGRPEVAWVMIVATLSTIVGYIFSGWLSQKIGRIKAVGIFAVSAIIVAIPLFFGLYHATNTYERTVYASLLVLVATSGFGPIPAFLSERFPTEIRNSACGFVFNAGLIIGSWSPIISIGLSSKEGLLVPLVLGLNMIIGNVIVVVGLKLNPETKDVDLSIAK
jgi:MHS family proline/betaine transporter-like MFS transporter